MTTRYPIPAGPFEHEIEVRRSRFRATIAPAASVAEARACIDRVRAADPGATHHCWAYLVGAPGATDRVGMSDDGEPHGTAGRPMLQVLSHAPVGDVVAIVTRWFGGTKLGTGGLVRAYSQAVRETLDRMPTAERVAWRELEIDLDYAAAEPLRRLLPAHEAEVIDESYEAKVTLRVRLPQERCAGFACAVTEMSNGTARIRGLG